MIRSYAKPSLPQQRRVEWSALYVGDVLLPSSPLLGGCDCTPCRSPAAVQSGRWGSQSIATRGTRSGPTPGPAGRGAAWLERRVRRDALREHCTVGGEQHGQCKQQVGEAGGGGGADLSLQHGAVLPVRQTRQSPRRDPHRVVGAWVQAHQVARSCGNQTDTVIAFVGFCEIFLGLR